MDGCQPNTNFGQPYYEHGPGSRILYTLPIYSAVASITMIGNTYTNTLPKASNSAIFPDPLISMNLPDQTSRLEIYRCFLCVMRKGIIIPIACLLSGLMTLSTWMRQGRFITVTHILPDSRYPSRASSLMPKPRCYLITISSPSGNYMSTVDPCYLRHTYYGTSGNVPGRCPGEQASAFPFNYRNPHHRKPTNDKRISKLNEENSR